MTKKECIVMVWDFDMIHPYLYSSKAIVEINHISLTHVLSNNYLKSYITHWILALEEY